MQDCSFGLKGNFDSRMEKFSKGFDADNEARTRTRIVAVGFESVDASIAYGRNGIPFFWECHVTIFVARLFRAVAAR